MLGYTEHFFGLRQETDLEKLIGVLFALAVGAALFAGPATWVVMLALGNFGFSQFGFWDCLPAGIIIAMLTSNSD